MSQLYICIWIRAGKMGSDEHKATQIEPEKKHYLISEIIVFRT